MSVLTIFYGIIVVFGAYLIISPMNMKKSGKIGSLIITEEETAKCKDKQGFIDFIYWKEMVLGIVFMIVGVIEILNDGIWGVKAVSIVGMLIFLATFLWFQNNLTTARGKFFK